MKMKWRKQYQKISRNEMAGVISLNVNGWQKWRHRHQSVAMKSKISANRRGAKSGHRKAWRKRNHGGVI
jgi:hypothetical protein